MSTVNEIMELLGRDEKSAMERESELVALRAQHEALRAAGGPAVLALCQRIVRQFGSYSGGDLTISLRSWSRATPDALAREIMGDGDLSPTTVIGQLYDAMIDESGRRTTRHVQRKGALAMQVGIITEIIRAATEAK